MLQEKVLGADVPADRTLYSRKPEVLKSWLSTYAQEYKFMTEVRFEKLAEVAIERSRPGSSWETLVPGPWLTEFYLPAGLLKSLFGTETG